MTGERITRMDLLDILSFVVLGIVEFLCGRMPEFFVAWRTGHALTSVRYRFSKVNCMVICSI